MTTPTKTLKKADLLQFTGTENWYRHAFVRSVLYTDGAKYVAEAGGAYWLLDEIAFVQKSHTALAAEEFQVWKLTVHPAQSGTLTCEDGNGNVILSKPLEYTDFPLDEITLYYTNNAILLPSEY